MKMQTNKNENNFCIKFPKCARFSNEMRQGSFLMYSKPTKAQKKKQKCVILMNKSGEGKRKSTTPTNNLAKFVRHNKNLILIDFYVSHFNGFFGFVASILVKGKNLYEKLFVGKREKGKFR